MATTDSTTTHERCTGCHELLGDNPVIGVATGTIDDYGRTTVQYVDWYHVRCWTPLPTRDHLSG